MQSTQIIVRYASFQDERCVAAYGTSNKFQVQLIWHLHGTSRSLLPPGSGRRLPLDQGYKFAISHSSPRKLHCAMSRVIATKAAFNDARASIKPRARVNTQLVCREAALGHGRACAPFQPIFTGHILLLSASLGPIHTNRRHFVITEALENIYANVDFIPSRSRRNSPTFSPWRTVSHSSRLDGRDNCVYVIPDTVLVATPTYLRICPGGVTRSAVKEHAIFGGNLQY